QQWLGDLSGDFISSNYGGSWTSKGKRILLEHDEEALAELRRVIGAQLRRGGGSDDVEITKLKVKAKRKSSKKKGNLLKVKIDVRFEESGERGRWKRKAVLTEDESHAFAWGTVSYQGTKDPGELRTIQARLRDSQDNVFKANAMFAYSLADLQAGAELRIESLTPVDGPCTLECWWDTFPNTLREADEPFGTIPLDRVDGGEAYCGLVLTLEDPK
ncbi:MAG: hypothetical protein ACYTDY_19180, partial [Planctomycetota bacterium]